MVTAAHQSKKRWWRRACEVVVQSPQLRQIGLQYDSDSVL